MAGTIAQPTRFSNLLLGDTWSDDFGGRVSTKTEAGAAITHTATYPYGEAIELRYTSSADDNGQYQGIFLEVRTSAANTSTIRGMEVHAAQEGAVAVGTLEGGNFQAITRSTTTGNVTNMFGVTGEVTHNSSAYTGTVTTVAAVRGKFSVEDGTTYTNSSVFLAQAEAITGGKTIGSYFRAQNISGVTATALIDASAATLATHDTDQVSLISFKNAGGTTVTMSYDTSAGGLVFA